MASRTDRGVSARANALGLRSGFSGPTLLRTLNGVAPDLRFTAASPIPQEFRVRRAVRRTYRYFDGGGRQDFELRTDAAALFVGAVDVRSFGRSVPAGSPLRRPVESVSVARVAGGSVVEVRARSFVWGMVRKIVAALREVEAGRLSIARLRGALDGTVRLSLPLAEPEPLVLWDVEYPFPWTISWRGPNRAQSEAVGREASRLWSRGQVLDALGGPAPPAPGRG
ncbi:MAG: hypothetical protein WBF81_07705 [Thermoplasmata archaeon]